MGLGMLGVWLAFPLALALKSVLGLRAYRSGTWTKAISRR